ncbi:hypothetical protein B0I35DRAFT_434018 [Stachybotrys elegans]|uniref:Uncharacterized protein n=1 Tax=Stachybotrys elegans TaxID=80388 RepID=A0A8K0STN2_9HYPO|nr:hypothetical protein B0I35DRAFT_434018 [Stachybotrys elegans]
MNSPAETIAFGWLASEPMLAGGVDSLHVSANLHSHIQVVYFVHVQLWTSISVGSCTSTCPKMLRCRTVVHYVTLMLNGFTLMAAYTGARTVRGTGTGMSRKLRASMSHRSQLAACGVAASRLSERPGPRDARYNPRLLLRPASTQAILNPSCSVNNGGKGGRGNGSQGTIKTGPDLCNLPNLPQCPKGSRATNRTSRSPTL